MTREHKLHRMKDRDLKPRKAPQQERSRETIDAVFEAMLQVLERQDASDPSMQAIAERAGVSVGSVYQYFPSKASLVNSLIAFHLRKQAEIVERAIDQATGLEPEAGVRFLVDAIVDDKRSQTRVERGLIRYFLRAGDLMTLTQVDERMVGAVHRLLVTLGPKVRATDLALAAFIITNALRTSVLLSIVQAPERLDDPRFKDELVRLVLGYLSPQT